MDNVKVTIFITAMSIKVKKEQRSLKLKGVDYKLH